MATGDPLTNEDEYTYDWAAARAWKQTLTTGKVDSANVQPSFYPEAVFWPMNVPSPFPGGGTLPPGPGPSPGAIAVPGFGLINLPCIKIPDR